MSTKGCNLISGQQLRVLSLTILIFYTMTWRTEAHNESVNFSFFIYELIPDLTKFLCYDSQITEGWKGFGFLFY